MGFISDIKKKIKESKMPRMEENLDMPLKEVLEIMQARMKNESTYFGVPTIKSTTDSWIYQEIIYEMKPDVILEIGNEHGGSTLMLAHLLDLIGNGKVIGLDISHAVIHEEVKKHPRITLIEGDACGMYDEVMKHINEGDRVLVIEDSSHTYENTLNVLRTYSGLTRAGDYFIVEDSICHHGVDEGPSPGPYEAIEAFVSENKDFKIDRKKEAFCITWNPKGFLKRVK
jgi:cephalosporin hydroxylase